MPSHMDQTRAIKAQKRQEAEAFQLNHQVVRPHEYAQPAIGKTGGADNVGWEVHVPHQPVRYYATQEQALAKLG